MGSAKPRAAGSPEPRFTPSSVRSRPTIDRRLSAEGPTHPMKDFAATKWPELERAPSRVGDLVPMLQQPATTRFHRERRSTLVERTRRSTAAGNDALLLQPTRSRRSTAAMPAGRRSILRMHLPEPTQVEVRLSSGAAAPIDVVFRVKMS